MIKSLIRPTLTALGIVQDQIFAQASASLWYVEVLCQAFNTLKGTSILGTSSQWHRLKSVTGRGKVVGTIPEHFQNVLCPADTEWGRTAKCDTVVEDSQVWPAQRRDTIVITSAVYPVRPREKLAWTLDWLWDLCMEFRTRCRTMLSPQKKSNTVFALFLVSRFFGFCHSLVVRRLLLCP